VKVSKKRKGPSTGRSVIVTKTIRPKVNRVEKNTQESKPASGNETATSGWWKVFGA
jgi:hypothetical protein